MFGSIMKKTNLGSEKGRLEAEGIYLHQIRMNGMVRQTTMPVLMFAYT